MAKHQYVGPTFSGTGLALGVVTVPECSIVAVDISGLTSNTVAITASTDGVNYNTAKIRPINVNTGALASSSDLGNGLYTFDARPFSSLSFATSSTSETVTVRTGLGR